MIINSYIVSGKHWLIFFSTLFLFSCTPGKQKLPQRPESIAVHKQYLMRIHQLDSIVNKLIIGANHESKARELQELFAEAKYAYKRTEYLTELYFPFTAKSLNGPPISEVEFDDPNQIVIDPEGFQVIEELLFPAPDSTAKKELIFKLEQLGSNVHRLMSVAESTALTDSHIFDAIRLEIFRIITLGVSGFDSPAALNSIPEAKEALKELAIIYNIYNAEKGENESEEEISTLFSKAIKYLDEHNDFENFDRLSFIFTYANPLSELILKKQEALEIPIFDELRVLSPEAKSVFDPEAYNLEAFSPAYNRSPTSKQIALGEMLFFDPVLSGNNSRACASCHLPEKVFTDGQTKSMAFKSDSEVLRNAPTIINAGLQASQFYDGRVAFLEDQVTDVVLNENEMHGNFGKAVGKLKSSEEYNLLFRSAFEEMAEPVNEKAIRMALASFVRSKTSLNSPFDQYMRGDTNKLTALEKEGFNLFMGKAACGTCHFMPLFNGTVPPSYKVSETEILGVPASSDTTKFALDEDLGKFHLFNKDLHKFAFKTPTVRNIVLTAPYMHNGVFETLEEVMDFYNDGGGQGRGIELPHQTLSPDALNLSDGEVKAIIAFMNALTDTTGLVARPKGLPVIHEVALKDRIVGGN